MSEYTRARIKNALATNDLAERDAAKRKAGTTNPDRDASAENLARVRRSGNGPWTPAHGDSTNARNTRR